MPKNNFCDVSFHCFSSTHTSSISCKEDCEYYSENGHEGEIAPNLEVCSKIRRLQRKLFSLFLKCWLISVYIGSSRYRGISKKVGPDIENLKTPKYHETGQIDFP